MFLLLIICSYFLSFQLLVINSISFVISYDSSLNTSCYVFLLLSLLYLFIINDFSILFIPLSWCQVCYLIFDYFSQISFPVSLQLTMILSRFSTWLLGLYPDTWMVFFSTFDLTCFISFQVVRYANPKWHFRAKYILHK